MNNEGIKVQFRLISQDFDQTFKPDETIEQVCQRAASQNKIDIKNVNFYFKGQIIILENNNKPINQFVSKDKVGNPKIIIEMKSKNTDIINNPIKVSIKGTNDGVDKEILVKGLLSIIINADGKNQEIDEIIKGADSLWVSLK